MFEIEVERKVWRSGMTYLGPLLTTHGDLACLREERVHRGYAGIEKWNNVFGSPVEHLFYELQRGDLKTSFGNC